MPPAITPEHVDALVTRFNNSADLWEQGLYTHAAAGRDDFVDRDTLIEALDRLIAAIDALQSVGLTEIDFYQAIVSFKARASARFDTGVEVDLDDTYYAVLDIDNGTIVRGRMTPISLQMSQGNGVATISPDGGFPVRARFPAQDESARCLCQRQCRALRLEQRAHPVNRTDDHGSRRTGLLPGR